ncbi:MAG: aldehyde reductase [Anaerolineae bacterium]|nr:aldehyde reductase [Anaerolineae bacterium]
MNEKVLVTGGTGFVAGHCILQLMQKDYRVMTSLRDLSRREEVINMLKFGGLTSFTNLDFVKADLSKDENWDAAVKDCDFVLHVASPIHLAVSKDENSYIKPAVEGTLRVLRAARDAGVKRVVLTSNFGAVGYSHKDKSTLITEAEWTNPEEKGLSAYNKSKTLAERAAWDFIQREGGPLELSTVNPMAIFGPALSPVLSSGFDLIKGILDGSTKAIPNMILGIVDVRDVADLHIRAMIAPAAKGERFLALAGGVLSLPEIAVLLKNQLGDRGKKISTLRLPDWVVDVAALFSPQARALAPQLSMYKNASNEKARSLLGWTPRTNEEAIFATLDSMIEFGWIK